MTIARRPIQSVSPTVSRSPWIDDGARRRETAGDRRERSFRAVRGASSGLAAGRGESWKFIAIRLFRTT
jgi:hypothetical protein